MDAENTHQVFDWLWSSGQLSGRDIHALPALGIDVVVNLALPTSSNALPGEAERVTGESMAYVQIPVEWERPRPDRRLVLSESVEAASFPMREVWTPDETWQAFIDQALVTPHENE